MVSSTCETCNHVLSFDDDAVPPSGMVVKCPECSASVTIMPADAAGLDDADFDLDDSDLLDLGEASAVAAPPAADRFGDLPVPKTTDPFGDLPAPKGSDPFGDLPAPKSTDGHGDLPAPKSADLFTDLPEPKSTGRYDDLPAPKFDDPFSDLPAPKKGDPFSDLPAPKTTDPFADLPGPKDPFADLPGPKDPFADLPGPKDPFADLPGPRSGDHPGNLPTPKHDPAGNDLTPKGASSVELPAPKRVTASKAAADDFFGDDALGSLDLGDALGGDAAGGDAPGSDALGDLDLGGDALGGDALRGDALGGNDGAFDLDALDLSPSAGDQSVGGLDFSLAPDALAAGPGDLDLGGPTPQRPGGLDLGPAAGGSSDAGGLDLSDSFGGLDLDEPGGGDQAPFGLDSLDLESPAGGASPPQVPLGGDDRAGGDRFGEVELPDIPGAGGEDVVTFAKPSGRPSRPSAPLPPRSLGGPADDGALELDRAPEGPQPPSAVSDAARERLAKREARAAKRADGKQRSGKQRQIVALAALLLVAAGAGGFYFWQSWSDSRAASAQAAQQIVEAERALATDAPGHWKKAIAAAERAAGEQDAAASAVIAEAHFAAAVDTGIGVAAHIKKGNEALAAVRKKQASGPHVAKAEGLQSLAERRPGEAINRLRQAAKTHKDDVNAQLYFGWANQANYRYQAAVAAFDQALTLSADHMAARYGLGRAYLELGARDKAEEAFRAVIQRSRDRFRRDHIGAMVGLAQLAEVDRFSDRENRYLEILNTKIEGADPRHLALAWSLAGDEALRAGRIAVAEERYGKALALDSLELGALVGQAKVARAEGKLETAAGKLDQVRSLAPGHIDAALTLAEVALERDDTETAVDLLAGLFERDPAIEDPPTLTRMQLLRGKLLAQAGDSQAEAEAAYRAAMETAPESDIGPTLALAELLVSQNRGAEAVALLEPVRSAAREDPALAVSLGVAYLGTGDLAAAEDFFRTAVKLRPEDAEARAQLGRALLRAGKDAEALRTLREAYALGEKREDIGLEIAQKYQLMAQDAEAAAMYDEILAQPSPSLTARSLAGRFYVGVGQPSRAAEIAASILAEDPDNAGGLYITGAALFAEGAYVEARERFGEAMENDPLPVYLEAAGRASEMSGDFDDAMNNYGRAKKAEPDYLAPRLGEIRIHIARNEFAAALAAISATQEIAERLPRTEDLVRQKATLLALEGQSHLEMRDYPEAVLTLKRAIAADPGNGQSYYFLGLAYGNLGKPSAAAGALASATRVAGGDERWLPDAYRRLGYAHREAGNRGGAVTAFRHYLDIAVDDDSTQVAEVKRLLAGLQGN